jgi:hypothetical protein
MPNSKHHHVVQFYEADPRLLITNVSAYISEGLQLGEGIVVITTPEHAEAFTASLKEAGIDPQNPASEGRLIIEDADRTLGKFMLDGNPDWNRFEATIKGLISRLPAHAGVRAFGEMVGLLWERGSFSAAIALEEFWNELLSALGCQLFCAYPINIFDSEFQVRGVHAVLCDHTHVLPSCIDGHLDRALNRAIDEVLGERASAVRPLMASHDRPAWGVIPAPEAKILWLRNNLPDADLVIEKAHEFYRANCPQASPVPL